MQTVIAILHRAPFYQHTGFTDRDERLNMALRPGIIQRKIMDWPSNSSGVHSAQGALSRSRLLTFTTALRQQGRDIWPFSEQIWIAHNRGVEMLYLLPDP